MTLKRLLFLWFVSSGLLSLWGYGSGEIVACRYGERVRFGENLLAFPDFTVRFLKRSELTQLNSTQPWIVTVFEVLDEQRKTIGGDLRFTSEKRVNGRRFDVHRKIYVAEMYESTGAAEPGSQPSRHEFSEQEIIIWDEATAVARNPRLREIWKNPKFDARYSSHDAYADGVLLPEFTDTSRVISSGLEEVPMLPFNRLPPTGAVVKASFGVAVDGRDHLMEFPRFKLRWFEREVTRSDASGRPRINYKFRIYSNSEPRIDQLLIRSEAWHDGNARAFEFEGNVYLLEMHHTTAGLPAEFSSGGELPRALAENQLVIWSKETAGGNPRILKVWPSAATITVTKAARVTVVTNASYAAGVALLPVPPGNLYPGLTLTLVDRLDTSPWVVDQRAVIYPEEFRGSGLVGHLSGGILLLPDGSVGRVDILSGNDQRFAAAVREAVKSWRFTPPKMSGQPVRPVVAFGIEIYDDPTHPQEFRWSTVLAN